MCTEGEGFLRGSGGKLLTAHPSKIPGTPQQASLISERFLPKFQAYTPPFIQSPAHELCGVYPKVRVSILCLLYLSQSHSLVDFILLGKLGVNVLKEVFFFLFLKSCKLFYLVLKIKIHTHTHLYTSPPAAPRLSGNSNVLKWKGIYQEQESQKEERCASSCPTAAFHAWILAGIRIGHWISC